MQRTSSLLAVREATIAELPAAADLWDRAHEARPTPLAVEMRGAAASESIARRMKTDACVLLFAELDGALAGMLFGSPAREDRGSGPIIPGVMHVSWVATDPARWGLGIATHLLESLIERARAQGFTRMQLWTHQSNVRAQRVYERLGFAPTGQTASDSFGEVTVHYATPL